LRNKAISWRVDFFIELQKRGQKYNYVALGKFARKFVNIDRQMPRRSRVNNSRADNDECKSRGDVARIFVSAIYNLPNKTFVSCIHKKWRAGNSILLLYRERENGFTSRV